MTSHTPQTTGFCFFSDHSSSSSSGTARCVRVTKGREPEALPRLRSGSVCGRSSYLQAGALLLVFLDRGLEPGNRVGQLLDGDDALVSGFLAHEFHHALGDIAEHDDIAR